jgi:tetratricopeptide (TPR) repeat protein
VALLGGEPGIGKTRLAAELVDALASDGYRAAWVSCPEDAGAPPFWAWRQLLGQLGVGDALRAGRAEPDPELARFQLFEAVSAALRSTASAGPVLLVLDDLHWADPGSRRLLGRVRAELATVPIVVLGTYRDTEPGADALCAEIGPERHVALAGLPPEDLGAALLTATGERVSGSLLVGLHARTSGNPYFAAEAVRLLRSEGRLHDLVEVPPGLLPSTVRAVLERRLRRLPVSVLALLGAAALLGDDLRPDVLAEVAETELGAVAVAVSAGREARLLAGDRFAHPLVREVFEAQLSTTERTRRHALAGAALAARYRSGTMAAAGAAGHLLAAARLGDLVSAADAVAMARAAAAEATVRAGHEDAVRLLTEALAVCPHSDDRGGLLCELAEVALAVGDPDQARAAYTEAAELARRAGRPELLAATALGLAGGRAGFEVDLRDPERVAVLSEALDALPSEDSALRAALLARLSVALAFTGVDEGRRDTLSARAVGMARRVADPRVLAGALAARCDAVSGPDHVGERLAAAEEMTALARAVGDHGGELLGRRLAVVALAEVGRWPAVDAEIAAYAATADRLGQPRLAWYGPLWRGSRALMRGDLMTADECAARLADLASASGSANARLLRLVQRMVRAGNSGQVEELAADFAQMARLVPDEPLVAACSFAFLHAHLGQPEQSRGYLDRVVADADTLPRDSEWLPQMAQVAVAAVLTGHRVAAEWAYRVLSPYPTLCVIEGIFAGTWGSVVAHLGLLADHLDDVERAADHFAAAIRSDGAAGAALLARTRRWAAGGAHPAAGAGLVTSGTPGRVGEDNIQAAFRRDGEVWTLCFAGRTARLRDSKGLRDLAVVLARPGEQTAAPNGATNRPPAADTGVLADRQALAAYRARLRELDTALDEADSAADPVRAERLVFEREALLAELSAVTGLGGRPRVGGSDAERARKAVTNRIRQAVDRIAEAHPELGRHLRAAVHTGTWCRYEPEHPVVWRL